MDIIPLIDRIGEAETAALFGLITGLVFGIAAQRSRFCLRAATVEFARRTMGSSVAVWLLTFSTAVVWVQGAVLTGLLTPADTRMMGVTGSWSGAIIGGLMFGIGMVLSRGCSGRLLVLAATGNLRSVVSGLIFAVVAQMSLAGWLSPLRDWVARLWMTSGGRNVNVLTGLHLPEWFGLALGIGLAGLALVVSRLNQISAARLVFASGVGFAVALGWVLTSMLSQVAFEPVTITSATFTGPSANTLMYFLERTPVLEFDVGLVVGVVLGAFIASWMGREFQFQGFEGAPNMRRSMIGAVFMGFGGMLAGGCAVGAGLTGGSLFVATAWVALISMWAGATVADYLVDQRGIICRPSSQAAAASSQ